MGWRSLLRDVKVSTSASRPWRAAVGLYFLIAVVVTLGGLGSTGLVMMEGMVAYTAERVLEGGAPFVPELYGEIYTYKPPLVYWLAALSLGIFGASEWALRLPGALASVGMGLAILILIGRATKPRVGLVAALAAITSVLWNQKGRVGDFDAILASLVGIAVAAACYNLAVGRARSSGWIWLLAYSALTAAFLTKGAPALMAFGPGLVGAAILSRQTRQLWSRGHLAGVGLLGLVAAAYFALLWSNAGPAAFDQPLDEAHRRGLEWSLETLARTFTKPFIVVGAFLPWSLCWPWAFAEPAEAAEEDQACRRLRHSALAFLALGVLAFMAVPTHETRYYLPLGVAAALVSALALERLSEPSKRASRFFFGVGLAFGVITLTVSFAPELAPSSRAIFVVLGGATVALIYLLERYRAPHPIALIVLVGALCSWAAETWAFRPHRARFRVLDTVAEVLDSELPENATVWALGEADIVGKNASLYYYLGRQVRTFHRGAPLPPTGSYVVLTASDLRELGDSSPLEATRLRLMRRVHHPWRLFLLYQIEAPPAPVVAAERWSRAAGGTDGGRASCCDSP